MTLSCLITFDGNHYSAPAAYAGRNVIVRGYVNWVEIAAGGRVVASRDVMDPCHYLPALPGKPRAFHEMRAVRRYPLGLRHSSRPWPSWKRATPTARESRSSSASWPFRTR
jgi:hypothetical protein